MDTESSLPAWLLWLFWVWVAGCFATFVWFGAVQVRNSARLRALKPHVTVQQYRQRRRADIPQEDLAFGLLVAAVAWPALPVILVGWGGYRLLVAGLRRRWVDRLSTE